MKIGYARTSTVDQDAGLEAQVRDLQAHGCEQVFSEQVSATQVARPELETAISHLREGDVLVVCKPDRLARSTADLLALIERVEARKAGLVILSMSGQVLDTTTPTGKLMLTMLGAVAEFERSLMLERQREGIAKAKADGKYKGRRPTAMEKASQVQALKAEGINPTEIARRLGISRMSVYRCLEGIGQDKTALRS
ncbi:integrase [Novacetimonas maltaceti]|uniref:DNA-invertase hin n=1 Tax=Novacetimonas maltaceti TaxID=1203393 RepID=A0A2S3VXA2_9PROT|nr:recombinase family protein [Novacetimonas maltaceti]POF61264.1 DNA-invertase hin [Novacetimonas maltaceti]PYD58228.1 integrase [Novacetimonas maltaceti]